MKLKSFTEIPTKVEAEVRDGALIHFDETKIVEVAVGRSLNWKEIEGSKTTAGKYFQCSYEVILPNWEARIARLAVEEYRNELNV